MERIQEIVQQFDQIYRRKPEWIVSAPGRVNLIGEHTDYNEGFVLPVALDQRILIASASRTDSQVQLYSTNFHSQARFDLNLINPDPQNRWINYPQGVVQILQKNGFTFPGADLCILGTIPMGAGLSSSAALEVASLITFSQLFHLGLKHETVIRFAHQAETDFVGVQCGIMDQYISVCGKKGNALFLDCRSYENKWVPFPKKVSLLICDTGIHRELAHSAYNQRREECRKAVGELSRVKVSVRSLRDVSIGQLQDHETILDPVIRKRARHVVTENERVLQSVEALQRNDLIEFGQRMYASHRSLQEDYEVSSPELDAIVDVARELKGIFGARMTGAGFGGCAICLVEDTMADSAADKLLTGYQKRTGRPLIIYRAIPADGASVIDARGSASPVLYTEMKA